MSLKHPSPRSVRILLSLHLTSLLYLPIKFKPPFYPWFKLPRSSSPLPDKLYINSLLNLSIPSWLCLHPSHFSWMFYNTFRYKPSKKVSKNHNRCRQVLWWPKLAGHMKDAPWWSSTGEVPRYGQIAPYASYFPCPSFLQPQGSTG